MSWRGCVLALLFLLGAGPSLAGEAAEAAAEGDCPLPDDEGCVVITARRCGQPVFETDRSLHTLQTEDILRLQAQSLPDALLETSGVFMQRTNAGAGSPFLRGMVGPENLILVDGIRFNNSTYRTGPNQYLAQIDPTAIGRVELMLGPGSVLYGSDAVGGVLNVLPAGWRRLRGASALGGMRYGSADQSSALWAEAGFDAERGGLLIGGAFRRFDNLRAGGGKTQPLSDYTQGAFRASSRLRLGADWELGANYLANRMRWAGRADRLYEGRFRFYDNDDDLLWLDLRYRPEGLVRELRLALSLHRTWERVDLYRCSMPDDPTSDHVSLCLEAGPVSHADVLLAPLSREELTADEVWTPGLLLTGEFVFWRGRIRLNTGLEAYGDFISSAKEERRQGAEESWRQLDRGNFSDDSSYGSMGVFALAEGDLWRIGDQALVLTMGGRVSHFSAHAPEVPGLGDVDYRNTGLVGTASLKYLHGRLAMAYVNFSQGFRAPNLQETTLLGDTGSKFEVPNDELKPVKSNGLELGGRLGWNVLHLGLHAFVSFLEDAVDERELDSAEWLALGLDPDVVGDKPVVQRVNSASGLIWGMESSLDVGPFRDTWLWARVAWVRGEVENAAGETTPIKREPPLMGAAGVRYRPAGQGFYAEIFTRFASQKTRLHPSDLADLRICEDPQNLGDTYGDSGLSCPGTKAWATMNLRAGYRFDRDLRLDLAATNLTDLRYRYHGSGIDAPGIGLSFSVEARY